MGAIMLQGTGSDVGKSVLVAGICRAFVNRGFSVRPFKPQNMSNNAAVTVGGGEIGRAQALQALACNIQPHTDMNPILLKPQADHSSQLIVQGKVRGQIGGGNFRQKRATLMPYVLESWGRLRNQCDIVVVEGAGSPAEVNLRAGDIANMGFARAADVPVILVGDIDRGGVIASLVGTGAVIDPSDAAMVRGFIINKFRGDPTLFTDGYRQIEQFTGWRGYGVVPWLSDTAQLPSEDAVVLERNSRQMNGRLRIACPILPRIANFDDLDPLKSEADVDLIMVSPGKVIPSDCAMIILPGSKATISDMATLREQGWDIDILSHYRRGGSILGICGGYQMLGRKIYDPDQIEGPCREIDGLGLLDIETTLSQQKALHIVDGMGLGHPFSGFEMHMGATSGADCNRPFAILEGTRPDGAINANGQVMGTYVHGAFASTSFRGALLERIGGQSDGNDHPVLVNDALNSIAAELEKHLDMDALLNLALETKHD